MESRLNGVVIDRLPRRESRIPHFSVKVVFECLGKTACVEELTSLNTLALLPELLDAGVKAIKLEGVPSPAYIGQVVSVWRQAIDQVKRDPVSSSPNLSG